eukprot:4251204-Prymnesium_polylepis.1
MELLRLGDCNCEAQPMAPDLTERNMATERNMGLVAMLRPFGEAELEDLPPCAGANPASHLHAPVRTPPLATPHHACPTAAQLVMGQAAADPRAPFLQRVGSSGQARGRGRAGLLGAEHRRPPRSHNQPHARAQGRGAKAGRGHARRGSASAT